MTDFYILGFFALLYCWMLYIGCRGILNDRIDSRISRSYRRKHVKGVKNKLFFASVRERCDLDKGNLYTVNIVWFVSLCVTTVTHAIVGWAEVFIIPCAVMITVLCVILGAAFPFTTSSRYEYKLECSHSRSVAGFSAFATTVLGVVITVFLIVLLWKTALPILGI